MDVFEIGVLNRTKNAIKNSNINDTADTIRALLKNEKSIKATKNNAILIPPKTDQNITKNERFKSR